MKTQLLTSLSNPRIKEIVDLRDGSFRRTSGFFVIDGYREVLLAVEAGMVLSGLYLCKGFLSNIEEKTVIGLASKRSIPLFEVSEKVYSKAAYGKRNEGLIAVAKQRYTPLIEIMPKADALIVVAQGLEKPGNLGAMLRSADAVGADAFIISDSITDIYNPNVVRSSLGTIFSTVLCVSSCAEAIPWLREKKIKIICADPKSRISYASLDYTHPCAIVLGSEKKGLNGIWIDSADYSASIPMRGKADSLNVSVAQAVFLFEALRQRTRITTNY